MNEFNKLVKKQHKTARALKIQFFIGWIAFISISLAFWIVVGITIVMLVKSIGG